MKFSVENTFEEKETGGGVWCLVVGCWCLVAGHFDSAQ
ncbi:hypothetical protein SAMN05444411_104215 [Lutibacter oricola]|uniref:Uncharacterized protein n=1 Tax=Lutibacter oricola TaxID=762486 RepID=A0A1H3AS94_9FLAO|nr:hypothetical protein SAMN05444411_104215 [Lutibacter oricola]